MRNAGCKPPITYPGYAPECCKLTCVCQENVELEKKLRRKEAELAEKVDKYLTYNSIVFLFLSAGETAKKNSAATGIQ